MAGPTLRIEAPNRTARAGGISKVATVRQNDLIGAAEGVVFQSDGCTFPFTEEVRCFATAPVPNKTYAGIEIEGAIGAPFTLVAGVACFINPDQDEAERAAAAFEAGKDRALEGALATWAALGTALPAGGSVIGAIATVDQELDDNYIAQGVILMSRADVVRAETALMMGSDGIPHTTNGTPVLASGRVTPGTVYGLGSISIDHTATQNYESYDLEGNMHYALAEAIFVLAVDCEFRVMSTTGV